MTNMPRYDRNAAYVRMAALLPGAVTAWEGKRAVVIDTDERTRDGGDWVVRLDVGTDRPLSLAGAAESKLPVFTDPYRVCSCHGDPWPCEDAYAVETAAREQMRQKWIDMARCANCGQERNLGALRSIGMDQRRYCRRVACRSIGDTWEREAIRARQREWQESQAFAEQMRGATS